jgi:hypothetical protein
LFTEPDDGIVPCYCGSASVDTCAAGAANGPCKDVIDQASGFLDSDELLMHLTDQSLSFGMADFVLYCDQQICMSACRRTQPGNGGAEGTTSGGTTGMTGGNATGSTTGSTSG